MEILDERLRAAVGLRDERLAALGEATLSAHEGGERALAFAQTLDHLDTEHAAAQAAWDSVRVELASAQTEQYETQAQLERDLEALAAKLKPLQKAQDFDKRALATLKKAAQSAKDQHAHQLKELEGIADRLKTTTDDELRAQLVEKTELLQASMAALLAEEAPRAQQMAQLTGSLSIQQDAVGELERQHAQAKEDGEAAVGVAKARLNSIGAELEQAKLRMERLRSRRRAVLMDLGHEVVHAFPEARTPTQEMAREALKRIESLRSERRMLEQQRMGIDWVPVERTFKIFGALLLLVLGVWIWL